MSSFWEKVEACPHLDDDLSPDYAEALGCVCNGYEVHCLKCGVYMSVCSCGEAVGMSGWPVKRWKRKIRETEAKWKRTRTTS